MPEQSCVPIQLTARLFSVQPSKKCNGNLHRSAALDGDDFFVGDLRRLRTQSQEKRTTGSLRTVTRGSISSGTTADPSTDPRIAGFADYCSKSRHGSLYTRPLAVLSGSATGYSCNSHCHTSR